MAERQCRINETEDTVGSSIKVSAFNRPSARSKCPEFRLSSAEYYRP